MAEFTPSKKTAQDFNDGVEYVDGQGNETGDAVQAETINNLVESALYSQQQAENAANTASSAVDTSNNALTVANGFDGQIKAANSTANFANITSQEAKDIAEEAKEIANDAQKGVGTKVSVDGEVVATFDADTKADSSEVLKNFYTLGVYDTYVSNGDGTGTITRKTGYIFTGEIATSLSMENESIKGYKISSSTLGLFTAVDSLDISCKNNRNLKSVTAIQQWYGELNSIAVHADGIRVVTDGKDGTDSFIVQYLLPDSQQYTEQVIENQPIHTFDGVLESWLRDEWEKGLNLFDVNNPYNTFPDSTQVQYYIPVKGNTVYTISWEDSSPNKNIHLRVQASKNHSYDDVLVDVYNQSIERFIVPENANAVYVILYDERYQKNVMLTEGGIAYQYKNYFGSIIRQKEQVLSKRKVKYGLYNGGGTEMRITINHGLGVIPSSILVQNNMPLGMMTRVTSVTSTKFEVYFYNSDGSGDNSRTKYFYWLAVAN